MKAGIDMTHVPYKGIAQMMTDILGNQIPLGSPAAASAVPQREGREAQGTRGDEREALVAAFPTCRPSRKRASPDYDVSAWNGLLAPARTPDEIVAKIHADVVKVAQSRRNSSTSCGQQAMEVELWGRPSSAPILAAELDKWSKLVKDSGAKLD